MGWVNKETNYDGVILQELKKVFPSKETISRGVTSSGSGSVYEYLTDYIKDYYDVTPTQCHRVAKMLADSYGITKFYATD